MRHPQTSPLLADAADVLSVRLEVQLERLSRLLKPHTPELDRRFRNCLRKRRFDSGQIKALSNITPGAAARIFAAGHLPGDFFEMVEYSGRRLAKLNVPPAGIVRALREYDRVLDPLLVLSYPDEYKNLRWAREQLQFATILTLNNAYYQVREAETEAFYELFRAEMQAEGLDDLLERFVATLTRFCHAEDGRLRLFDNGDPEFRPRREYGQAETPPPPRLIKRLARPRLIRRGTFDQELILDKAMRSRHPWFWSVPLMAGSRLAGVLQLAFGTEYQWLPRELDLLAAAAERCLQAAEKTGLIEDLAKREAQIRQLAGHMMQVEEEERRRIGRDLHDEAGQALLCVRLKLEMLGKTAPAGLHRTLEEARELTEHAVREVRRILAALSPAVLEQLGLAAAIRQLAKRFREHTPGVRLHLPPRLPPLARETQTAAYRLVQECFHNITRHSRARTVNVSLSATDRYLRLTVEDDGDGFDVEAVRERQNSFGLAGMRERVALLGGRLEITSRRGQGTRILAELPISRAQKKGSDARLKQSA